MRTRLRCLAWLVVAGCTPSSADDAQCVVEAIKALRPDSLCHGQCGTIIVDSVVRNVPGLAFGVPIGAHAGLVVSAKHLAQLSRFSPNLLMGTAVIGLPSVDTLVVSLYRVVADSIPNDVVLFGLSFVAPGGYLTTDGVRLRVARGSCRVERHFRYGET